MSSLRLVLFIFFSFWNSILALSIDREHGQKRLSSTIPKTKIPTSFRATSMILAITAIGSNDERYAELPLRQRISPGADFPHRLKTAKIVALMNADRQAASLEQLNRVSCRVLPVLSIGEKGEYFSLKRTGRDWPRFTLGDGAVQFEQPSSRWFLAGRDIESYECT